MEKCIYNSIITDVGRLVRRFGTRDPLILAEALGIDLEFRQLGNIKGMYANVLNNPFIFLNERLDDVGAKIVCAHELGHHRMQGKSVRMAQTFSDMDFVGLNNDRFEYEANLFCAELTIPDDEIEDCIYRGYTSYECARALYTDPALVALKLELLRHKGNTELNRVDYNRDFLK